MWLKKSKSPFQQSFLSVYFKAALQDTFVDVLYAERCQRESCDSC